MAEQVQTNIEEMIPELEQLERIGFFTGPETKLILKKRKAFEYKLCRRTRLKDDYLDYIQYEVNVLKLVKKRRRDTGYSFKRKEIDITIIQRIHKLFKIAETRFHNDVKLWLSHIEFSKKQHETALVGRLYTSMLQMHSHKAGLWILAAKWELETNKSIDNSRKLLQRGLRFNNNSKKLWIEYFRMELLNCEIMQQRNLVLGVTEQMDCEDNIILNGKIAIIVATNAVKEFPNDADFCHEMLKVCLIFNMPVIHDQLYDLLLLNYKECEVAWKVLAERKIIAVTDRMAVYKKNKERKAKNKMEEDEEADVEMKEAEQANIDKEDMVVARKHCLETYATAVKKLPTSKMYDFYLTSMFEHFDTSLLDVTVIFKEALEADALSESYTMKWIELSAGEKKKLLALNVFQRFPYSPKILNEYLHCLIKLQRNKELCINTVKHFFEFPRNTNNEMVEQQLWDVVFTFSCEFLKSFVDELFQTALRLSSTYIVSIAKTSYLKYIYDNEDISKVRNTYRKYHESPASVDFFRLYIAIEQSQEVVKHASISKCYEDSLDIYGASEPDLWLDYMNHEQSVCKTAHNVNSIYWKAKKTLKDECIEEFLLKYTLIQNA